MNGFTFTEATSSSPRRKHRYNRATLALTSGSRLGVYEVTASIGEGGMGQVYRARDTKLNRDVALKVLPDSFAADPDRLARFRREAQTLASLNHPNIAAIYGLEGLDGPDGTSCIVMEFVEGATLADRIAQGALPTDESIVIAKQIADALEAAHEQSIVHRDLKPANIKVRPDGTVKLLDFGLAKAFDPAAPASGSVSMSPTLSVHATMAGVILGTAAYMSPEQARGRAVDRRADVWALGCVLYEMLTGRRAFEGDDIAETIGAVIHKEPDWSRLPPQASEGLRTTIKRCLEKNPKQRIRDIGDVSLAIGGGFEGGGTAHSTRRRTWREVGPWIVAASAVALSVMMFVRSQGRTESREVVRFEIETPGSFQPSARASLAISPDGRNVAYVAGQDGKDWLFIRPVASVNAQRVAGSESASYPFWSPDNRYLAFTTTNGDLKRVDVAGGVPQTICRAPESAGTATGPATGTWSRSGTILLAVRGGGLFQVAASGGVPAALSSPYNGSAGPVFLPDGRHFFYVANSLQVRERAIAVGSLDGGAPVRLIAGASQPVLAGDYLLFQRDGAVFAQRFEQQRNALIGEPVLVIEQIGVAAASGAATFAATSGALVYRAGAVPGPSQLTWFDRKGQELGRVDSPIAVLGFALSPDEKRVALPMQETYVPQLWMLDIGTGVRSRLTGSTNDSEPVWSPDGRSVAFASLRNGRYSVFEKTPGERDEKVLVDAPDANLWPDDWSSDGRYLIVNRSNRDILAVPTTGDRTPIPVLTPTSQYAVDEAHLSYDGKWIAFASTETGRGEVYVASFPDLKGVRQVSANGGNEPHWRRDGRELFFLTSSGDLMVAEVAVAAGRLETGTPQRLFGTRVVTGTPGVDRYAVSALGDRFLILNPTEQAPAAAPIVTVLNWMEELKGRR